MYRVSSSPLAGGAAYCGSQLVLL